ncbi:type III secretion system export apparatus subunit SctU [Acanthopleuribacter pedis]|uniref:Flagellar biosynthetic protein FlhB n=1 Tax=Acanthopleuribacter pedis TaxID=442870 RepID=A0A8J7U8V1_9BACT|nr:type III secretion system export apparatus subunit SctU [Acanthopleuribacter pedis]
MSGEKTEQPTPKKLRDARKKGQVAKSKEVNSAVTLLAAFAVLWIMRDFFGSRFRNLVSMPFAYMNRPFEGAYEELGIRVIKEMMVLSLLPVGVVMFAAVVANVAQVGFMFTMDPVMPKLDKLNPAKGLKNMFAMKNFVELIKSIAKVMLLGFVIYLVLLENFESLVHIPNLGREGISEVLSILLQRVLIVTLIAYFAVAAFDFWFQQRQHTKQLKMSKDEVKREYKESEGEPLIKSKRRELHREMAEGDAEAATQQADVLVTNPTHFAVAISFNRELKGQLPRVVAKGEGALAQRLKKVAKKAEVPTIENVPLARGLYAQATVGDFIPADFIEAVAEVLVWAQNLGEEEEDLSL